MRKGIFLVFFILASLHATKGRCWCEVDKHGGGEFGYNIIDERHDGETNYLHCYDPGYSSCSWQYNPACDNVQTQNGVYSITNYIEPFVEQQISQGNYQGVCFLDNQISFSWTGNDNYNYHVIINN